MIQANDSKGRTPIKAMLQENTYNVMVVIRSKKNNNKKNRLHPYPIEHAFFNHASIIIIHFSHTSIHASTD